MNLGKLKRYMVMYSAVSLQSPRSEAISINRVNSKVGLWADRIRKHHLQNCKDSLDFKGKRRVKKRASLWSLFSVSVLECFFKNSKCKDKELPNKPLENWGWCRRAWLEVLHRSHMGVIITITRFGGFNNRNWGH